MGYSEPLTEFSSSRRKGVLFVDDEQLATKYFETRFSSKFPVFLARSPRQALEVLDSHSEEIGVVFSDERMPEGTGVNLLATVRSQHPEIVRVLTTAYMEMETLLEAINVGSVFAFVAKPWELKDLENVLINALQVHERQLEDSDLAHRKLDDLRSLIVDSHVHDLGILAAKLGHYVYNALCPVAFLLEQLLNGEVPNQYPRSFLQEVQSNVEELVQTLRDLERASLPTDEASHEPVNLREALDEAMQQTRVGRKERELEVEINMAETLPPVFGSRAEFEKLFRFMFAEQIVSLPKKSVVCVRGRPGRSGYENEGVFLEFEDFVPLAAKKEAGNLLQPFSLRGTDPREFGIFLSCCYMIARRHGGSFQSRAKSGEGIVYSFFLPYDYRKERKASSGLSRRMAVIPAMKK